MDGAQLRLLGMDRTHERATGPYLDYRLNLGKTSSALRRVVVGPTPHAQESLDAVKMALVDRGVKLQSEKCPSGVEVVNSRIPYRNW